MKINIVIITFIILCIFIFLIYKEGETKGEVKEIKKQQQSEIIIQNEVIKEKQAVFKRRAVFKVPLANDNLKWLRKNRCRDKNGKNR